MSPQAGRSTRKMAHRRRKKAMSGLLLALIIVIAIGILLQNASALGLGGGAILILLILLGVVPDLADSYDRRQTKTERRAVRGAVAEERVEGILGELDDDDYLVLHDIVSPYGNIDHIVISRQGGIFLIETKAHGGRVTLTGSEILVNGHPPEKNFIAQTLKNTYWLRDQIGGIIGHKPWIKSVIVFTNAFVEPGKPIRGVSVINRKYLVNFIQRSSKPKHENEILWMKRDEVESLLI